MAIKWKIKQKLPASKKKTKTANPADKSFDKVKHIAQYMLYLDVLYNERHKEHKFNEYTLMLNIETRNPKKLE